MKALVLLLGCLVLQEVSRDVLQAHPLLERVTTIEWCEEQLQRKSRLVFEGGPIGSVDTETLWPSPTFSDEKPRPWGLKNG